MPSEVVLDTVWFMTAEMRLDHLEFYLVTAPHSAPWEKPTLGHLIEVEAQCPIGAMVRHVAGDGTPPSDTAVRAGTK